MRARCASESYWHQVRTDPFIELGLYRLCSIAIWVIECGTVLSLSLTVAYADRRHRSLRIRSTAGHYPATVLLPGLQVSYHTWKIQSIYSIVTWSVPYCRGDNVMELLDEVTWVVTNIGAAPTPVTP